MAFQEGTIYLGDGLYAFDDGFHVEIFSHDGYSKQDRVFLDDDVLESLMVWLRKTGRIK